MSEILSTIVTVIVLLAGLAALIAWARNDGYAAPGIGHRDTDPLAVGTSADRVRAQRTFRTADADVRPATYESHATTATA
jgi:hypothetical protein